MPTIPLRQLMPCLQGVIPAVLATCSAQGEPNLGHLSQVSFVDDDHVAVSNQFFGKTMRNLLENPLGTILVPHPDSGATFKLLVQFEATVEDGPLFEEASAQIEAIASLTGMDDVFELRSLAVLRVLEISEVPSRAGLGGDGR